MARKHYTDRERMEIVKKFRASGLPINRYARENGIAYATLRDWAYAFRDLEGTFVRLDFDESDPSRLVSTQDVTMHMLSEERARAAELLQSLSQVTQKTRLPRRQRKRAAAWLP